MNLTVTEWHEEIKAALEYRRIFGREDSWETLENNYMNDPNGATAVGPNLIFSEGDTLLSALTLSDPYYVVEPEDELSAQSAAVVESLQNALAKPSQLNIKSHVEQSNLHNYLYGKGIMKIGYDSEFGWDPRWDLGTVQLPWGMSGTQFNKKGNRIENGIVRPGMPWVAPVLPHDFLVPWGTTHDMETAPWVAHRVVRLNAHIKQDPKMKNTTRLQAQMSMEDYIKSYSLGPKKDRDISRQLSKAKISGNMLYNELWEIHSKDDMRVRVICLTHDKFLRDGVDYIQAAIESYPFVASSFIYHPRTFWSTPQAYYLGQHQRDQFDLSVQIQKQRRINVAKFLMLGDAMTGDELTKLMSGDVGAVAKTKKNAGKKLQDLFMAFPKTSNFELIAETELIRRNARDAIGHSRNQAGEYDVRSRRSATEASFVREGSQTRLVRRENATTYLYVESMRKVIKIIFRFWTMPRDILVGQRWLKFNGAQLRGKYRYRADVVNHPLMTPTERTFEAMNMLAFFAQFPGLDINVVKTFVLDAVNDPRFTGFFGSEGQQQGLLQGQNSPASGASQRSQPVTVGKGKDK